MDSTVVAALIGAGAAFLALTGTAWVASAQLAHDRRERAKDRALQSKRDRLFDGIAAANAAIRTVTALANPNVDVATTSAKFNEATSALSAAGSVASLEVVSRGKDLVGSVGRVFLVGLAKRRETEKVSDYAAWATFVDWTINQQLALQPTYALLLAAVRRDLGIDDSSDAAVFDAIRVDAQQLAASMDEAADILGTGHR